MITLSAPRNAPTPTRPRRPVTREMVQARTRELAVLAGRNSLAVTQSDYEKARWELTGESEMLRQEAVLDAPAAMTAWENEGGHPAPPLPLSSIR